MSADFAVKPVHAPAPTEFVRPAPVAAREGVATDVPPEQSVSPTEAIARSRNDAELTSREVARKIEIDARTNAVILRIVDQDTRQVVSQIPAEAVLKLRAYNRALMQGATANQADHHANFES